MLTGQLILRKRKPCYVTAPYRQARLLAVEKRKRESERIVVIGPEIDFCSIQVFFFSARLRIYSYIPVQIVLRVLSYTYIAARTGRDRRKTFPSSCEAKWKCK